MNQDNPTGRIAIISTDRAPHRHCKNNLGGIANGFFHIYSDDSDEILTQAEGADIAIIEFEAGAREQFKICQKLRGMDPGTPAPVIGILRQSSAHLAAKGIDAGAFYVLEPRPSASMLQAVVRAALHRRAMETQLNHSSVGTMMPRTNFSREVESAASSCDHHDVPFGLMLCEISNYGDILESLGDSHIDQVYEQFGVSFLKHLESHDSIGQWEASQIAVLLKRLSKQETTNVFGTLLKSIDQKAMTIAGNTVHPKLRAGIAISPNGRANNVTASDALAAARRAIEGAREDDTGRIQMTKMLPRSESVEA